MTRYLVDIITTCSVSIPFDANSEEEALEMAKEEFEEMECFGDIRDVNFEILEKQDEQGNIIKEE